MVRSNDLTFIEDVVARLQAAGIQTWLFGGWAEELLELVPPRLHRDLDLLHLAADFQMVDGFMTADSQATEIAAKRFAHKRAFLHYGIMVELILVQATRPGVARTRATSVLQSMLAELPRTGADGGVVRRRLGRGVDQPALTCLRFYALAITGIC